MNKISFQKGIILIRAPTEAITPLSFGYIKWLSIHLYVYFITLIHFIFCTSWRKIIFKYKDNFKNINRCDYLTLEISINSKGLTKNWKNVYHRIKYEQTEKRNTINSIREYKLTLINVISDQIENQINKEIISYLYQAFYLG